MNNETTEYPLFNGSSLWSNNSWDSVWMRCFGTLLYGGISLVGVIGNLLVILVVFRVRGMLTPTNCYLVSLAASDTLFFLATVNSSNNKQTINFLLQTPTEIASWHMPRGVYPFGAAGCVLLTYLPYLGQLIQLILLKVQF